MMCFLTAEPKLLILGFINLIVFVYTLSYTRLCVADQDQKTKFYAWSFSAHSLLGQLPFRYKNFPDIYFPVREITKLCWTPDLHELYLILFFKNV